MAVVQPVYGPDYGQILLSGLNAYQGVKGMQMNQEKWEYEKKQNEFQSQQQKEQIQKKKELDELSVNSMNDPNAWNMLKVKDPDRALKIQELNKVDLDRFHKERAETALAIKDLPKEQRLLTLDQRIEKLSKEGRDPSNTIRLRDMIAKDDPVAEQTISNVLEQSYQAKILERPPQKKESKSYRPATEQEKLSYGVDPKKPYKIGSDNNIMPIGTGSGQTINVGTGEASGKVFAEELAKDQIKYLRQVSDKASTAEGQNQTLAEMKNIDVQQGAFEPMKIQLGAFGESLGIDMSSLANVPAGQAYNAKAKALVLAEMQKQKGPQTENDMKMIRSTVAGLGQTPEANKFLIDSAIAQNKRAIEERDFLNNWLQEKGNLNGAEAAWNKYKQKVPMVSKNLKQNGMPMFFNQFEELAREQDPNASRDGIISEWNRLDKEAKKSSIPTKKVVESAKPIPTMMNSRVPSSYNSEIPKRPSLTPIRDTSGGRYGL